MFDLKENNFLADKAIDILNNINVSNTIDVPFQMTDYPFLNLKANEIQNSNIYGIDILRIRTSLTKLEEKIFNIPKQFIFQCFILKGYSKLEITKGQYFELKSGMHNILYYPQSKGKFIFEKGLHDILLIKIPIVDFKKYLPSDKSIFCEFKEIITQQSASFLSPKNGIISNPILQLIESISHSEFEEELQQLFLKAKVFELLAFQLQSLCTHCPNSNKCNLVIAQKMYSVKDFMNKNLSEYYSLKDLAKEAGTNEFTLKKEFKNIFGMPVFEYWHQIKMEKAKELLLQNELPIAEISAFIGYKNPQHFSTAFKQMYNMPPRTLRQHNIK